MGFRIPGQSSRSQQLQKLAETIPGQQAANVKQSQQGQAMQIQQAVAAVPQQAAPTAGQVQQQGAAIAAKQGQAAVQAQQQGLQQTQQLAQLGMQETQAESRKMLQDKQLGIKQKGRELQNKLSGLSEDLKKELFDKEMTFAKDELGRTYFNERQLADWKILKAKSAEELAEFEQKLRQLASKKMQMLKTAQAKINQTLSQGYTENEQKLDNAQTMKLAKAKRDIEKKMAKERARQSGFASMLSGGLTIAGAVVGGIYGGPAGAAAGASLGSGVGNVAAGAMASES